MNTDQLFMQEALKLAKHAATLGEVPVGAVIVKDGKIIASAHNRRELDKDPVAHAEMLAIREASTVLGDWRLDGCTMYVTLEPCPMCAGALWLSRIKRCVYGCSDPKAGMLGSVDNLMKHSKLNHHYEVVSGVLSEECANELVSFFKKIRQKKKVAKTKKTTDQTNSSQS